MSVALLTTYLAPYRVPLYERLAAEHAVEVLCFGGGTRYVPPWFADLDAQVAAAPFPARRIHGVTGAISAARNYDALIAPFAGGAILPAAYAAARLNRRPFVLWASVWAQPRSWGHLVALPAVRHIYRRADAVVTYGEHVRRFVASLRGRGNDVFVAPQAVEPELFGRPVGEEETASFRRHHELGHGPLALYVGRLVPEKGVALLLEAWRGLGAEASLVLVGDGPLGDAARAAAPFGVRWLGPLPREQLAVAYASAAFALLPSIPTARFREPWGLVCNEAMLQGRTVIASDTVGAVAGGLVRDEETGLVVPAGDAGALGRAIARLLGDEHLRLRLGEAAREAAGAYTYDAMAEAFGAALAVAGVH
ncbi:MAG: glycosyltransferase family 4 protein [Solirubrobacterales bacterium]|nr:glycosyltransferase family 4 protein [Solirubrobacterales bacterium]